MYQPTIPLIQMSPGFRARRLGEVELGGLVLLRDASGGAGLALRADALSARADLAEGVLRLSGGPVRFERMALADTVVAIEVAFVLEAEFAGATTRAPASGDLLVSASRIASGLFVADLWHTGDGLLDLASAVIRPYTAGAAAGTVLPWRLVEREQRQRVLFSHGTPAVAAAQPRPAPAQPDAGYAEHFGEERARRTFVEDSD